MWIDLGLTEDRTKRPRANIAWVNRDCDPPAVLMKECLVATDLVILDEAVAPENGD